MRSLRVNEYQLEGGSWPLAADVVLRRMPQREEPDKWAIFDHGACLDKDGDWIFQPLPSNRDDEFLRSCRFDSAEEALVFWREGGFASRLVHYDEGSVAIIKNRGREIRHVQLCGHPFSSIVSSDEGTHYCRECEEEK